MADVSLARLMRLMAPLVLLLCLASSLAAAKPKYISRLPNGANVPSSNALGHVDANGTGALNAFGRHFIMAAREWSFHLCQYDSDGDGQTNGQELGDPCCEWMPGDTPRFTAGVSHPGDASQTANEFLWVNITCPNTTRLWAAARSDSSVLVRRSASLGVLLAVLVVLLA